MSLQSPPSIETLRAALELPDFDVLASQSKMAPAKRALQPPPDNARIGSVLALCYPSDQTFSVVLVKRPDHLRNHPGQIAFPGGKQEEGESLEEAALRETNEEIGVEPDQITIIGQLTPVYIVPSNFYVYPFLGWTAKQPVYVPSPDEVALILEVPISHFQDEANLGSSERQIVGRTFRIPHFSFGEHLIWGGTSVMLVELADRLKALG